MEEIAFSVERSSGGWGCGVMGIGGWYRLGMKSWGIFPSRIRPNMFISEGFRHLAPLGSKPWNFQKWMSEIWVIFLNWLFSRFQFFQFGKTGRQLPMLCLGPAMSVMIFSSKYAKNNWKMNQSPLKFLIGGVGGSKSPKYAENSILTPKSCFFYFQSICLLPIQT